MLAKEDSLSFFFSTYAYLNHLHVIYFTYMLPSTLTQPPSVLPFTSCQVFLPLFPFQVIWNHGLKVRHRKPSRPCLLSNLMNLERMHGLVGGERHFFGLIFYLLEEGIRMQWMQGNMQHSAYYLIKVSAYAGVATLYYSVHHFCLYACSF